MNIRGSFATGHAFTLRFRSRWGNVQIRATDVGFQQPNHNRLDCELKLNGEVLFPGDGTWYVGIPAQHAVDSDYAKATVLSLFALKPGDTDSEFFEKYNSSQLEFVIDESDTITMLSIDRYGEF